MASEIQDILTTLTSSKIQSQNMATKVTHHTELRKIPTSNEKSVNELINEAKNEETIANLNSSYMRTNVLLQRGGIGAIATFLLFIIIITYGAIKLRRITRFQHHEQPPTEATTREPH